MLKEFGMVAGDTANKIGTYQLAIVAQYHKVPYYIAGMPLLANAHRPRASPPSNTGAAIATVVPSTTTVATDHHCHANTAV